MKRLIAIVFISSVMLLKSGSGVFAQNQGQARIDSLRRKLPGMKDDFNKVLLLNALASEFEFSNLDSTMAYLSQFFRLTKEIKWKPGIVNYYNLLADVYYNKGNLQRALEASQKAISAAEETGLKMCIGDAYDQYAGICRAMSNYPESIKYCYAVLKIYEAMDSKDAHVKRLMTNAYVGLGGVYQDQHNYAEALKNYMAGLKVAQGFNYKVGVSSCYMNMGNIFTEQGKYKDALDYQKKALKINIETNNNTWQAYSYGNLGTTYALIGNYTEALKDFNEEVRISDVVSNKLGMAEGYQGLGNVYIRLKRYADAQKNLKKALALGREAGEVNQIKNAYEQLSILDSATRNWKAAFEDHKQFIFYRDSMLNKENVQKLTQNQMQYEFDKKEAATKAAQDEKDALARVEAKQQRKVRNTSFAGIGVLFLFTLVVVRQRNKVRKEKQRSDELLLNILPSETAEELKATGAAKAKDFEMVTVMFTDFRNFSVLSKKMNAQELVNEINYCYSAFDSIIGKYGIEKIKTIGDSYMCAGGLPVPNNTHPFDVVNAALEMRDFMLEEQRKREAEGRIFFEIKIGIHTGPVVAGIVGIKKFAYDIWGDTVNLASRMESADEAGKINISEATYELVKDKFACTHRGKIHAKNMGEIDMYFVERTS